MSSTNEQKTEPSLPHIPDHEGAIHFTPPLYRQRYIYTLDVIQKDPTLHSLVDIGCGTCQLMSIGKYRNPHVQLTAAIDINRFELDEACFRLKPLPVEYMSFRRETPLHMYVLEGDATEICSCFRNFDVVTLIEVIEHLHFNDLIMLMQKVFVYIRPRLVIVTTPNADFNVLFGTMPFGAFRHADHKFEFTRDQFQSWAQQIALTYNYQVEFDGLGDAPPHEQHRNIGQCTQIAIFSRPTIDLPISVTSSEFFQCISYCNRHLLVGMIDYPYGTKKSIELHEQVRYILEMYRLMAEDKARHGDDNHDTFPLTITCQILMTHPRLMEAKLTIENLRSILEDIGYKMLDNDQIILSEGPVTSVHGDSHDDEYDYHSINEGLERKPQSQDIVEECWD